MSSLEGDVLWTLKVKKTIDLAVQDAIKQLGYNNKAELTREAIREFLIRRKLFFLLGGEHSGIERSTIKPETALDNIIAVLSGIKSDTLRDEIKKARTEVETDFLK